MDSEMAHHIPADQPLVVESDSDYPTASGRDARRPDSEIASLEKRRLLLSGLGFVVAFSLGGILAWLGLLNIPFDRWIIALTVTLVIQGALWWASAIGWHRRSGIDRHFVFTPMAATAVIFIVYMWLAPNIRWLPLMMWFAVLFFVTGRAGLRSILITGSAMTLGYGAVSWRMVQLGEASAYQVLAIGLFFWAINAYGAFVLERLRSRSRASRRDLERIHDLTEDLICKVDHRGYLKSINPAFERTLGYSRSELLNQPMVSLVHPTDHQGTRQWIAALSSGEVLGEIENRFRCQDGTYRWFSWRCFALPGNDPMIYAIGRDVTASKRAAAALRKSEESLAEAQKLVHLGSWTFDIPHRRLEWSAELYRILGLSPTTYTPSAKASWSFVDVGQRRRVQKQLYQALRDRGSCAFEVSIHRADGQTRTLQSCAKVLTDPSGRPTGILGSVLDITEHCEARDALDQANRAKRELLANVSHEIRTPLNGILGVASLLLKEDLRRTTRAYVETIRSSGEGLLAIIDEILDLSKIEAGRLELESVPFSLPQTVQQIMALLRPKAFEKGLDLQSHVDPAVATDLQGDPTRLRQILLNLLGNAIKFTAKGSVELRITEESQDDEQISLTFAVRDTGIGIPSGIQDQLFQPFVQAETSTTRHYGGTGLGLAISRRLVELQGGQLTVQSTPGQGSTFRFSLPFSLPGSPPAALSSTNPRPRKTLQPEQRREHCILVAEDETVNRMVITKLLSTLGYRSQAVDNGYAVLEVLTRMEFSAILMDCQMPHLDGFETTRRIRQQRSAPIPIIAMTAHAMTGDRDRCLAAGMDDYLPKPFNEGRLARTIDRWMDGPPTQGFVDAFNIAEGPGIADRFDEAGPRLSVQDGGRSGPAIDRSSLEALIGSGSPKLMHSAAEIFLRQGPEKLVAMQGHLESKELDSLGRLAHGMAGTAGFVGAVGLSEHCRSLEELASDGDLAGSTTALSEIHGVFQRASEELRDILNEELSSTP